MKPLANPCFKYWSEHNVPEQVEWVRSVGRFNLSVQRHGCNWGYLITETTDVSDHVVAGKFDWDWTAMEACDQCEKSLAELITNRTQQQEARDA